MNQVKMFILNNNIDIMLVWETHFIEKYYYEMPFYSIYHIMHPNGTIYDGSAIIIKNNVRYHVDNFKSDFLKPLIKIKN